jgi:hypothetical protein
MGEVLDKRGIVRWSMEMSVRRGVLAGTQSLSSEQSDQTTTKITVLDFSKYNRKLQPRCI